MKRKMNLLFLSFFCVLLAMAAPGELKEKLQTLSGVSAIRRAEDRVVSRKIPGAVTRKSIARQAGRDIPSSGSCCVI